jgi:hypothetical protein
MHGASPSDLQQVQGFACKAAVLQRTRSRPPPVSPAALKVQVWGAPGLPVCAGTCPQLRLLAWPGMADQVRSCHISSVCCLAGCEGQAAPELSGCCHGCCSCTVPAADWRLSHRPADPTCCGTRPANMHAPAAPSRHNHDTQCSSAGGMGKPLNRRECVVV